MADDPKAGGGGKGPKSPWQLHLTPINMADGVLTTLVVATFKGAPAKEGTQIAFNINGTDVIEEPRRLNKDGRITVELNVGKTTDITVKAKTVEPGGFGVLNVKNPDAAKPAKPKPVLDVEDNPLGKGRWLQTINIFDQNGNGIGGVLRLVPRKQFKVNGTYVPEQAPDKNPYVYDIIVPVDGITIEMEIEDRETEIDSYILGTDVKYQFRLFGPGVSVIVAENDSPALVRFFEGCEAEAKSSAWMGEERSRELPRQLASGMISRALFAWFSTLVLLVGLQPDWWTLSSTSLVGLQPYLWMISTAFMVCLLLTAVVMIKNDVGMSVWNKVVIRPTMRTNNRWAWFMIVCLAGFTWVTWTTDTGEPLLNSTVNTYMEKTVEHKTQLEAQRRKNRKLHGHSKTDAQLGLHEPTPTPTLSGSTPDSTGRDLFHWRVAFWILYAILTLTYRVIAWIDEYYKIHYAVKRKILEKSEGSAGKLAKGAVNLAVTASGADFGAGSLGNFIQSTAKEGARETFWNVAFHNGKKLYDRMKRW